MGRCLALLAILTLAGCYNPPYPSDTDEAGAAPPDTSSSQEARMRARERRDGAAGSGSSVTPN